MTDISHALDDMLNHSELSVPDALDRHFTPDYRQRTDGEWSTRSEFAAHAEHLRAVIASARITVLDELSSGDTYADRHIVDLVKRDGGRIRQEVYVFGTRATDGRFSRIEETTLMLDGDESDRGIGSAR